MNVELFFDINGDKKKVELSESVDYSLNKQFIDLNDLTSYTTDYSKTIKIPMTPANNELFNFVFKIQSIQDKSYVTYTVNEKIKCYLMWNNNVLLEGWFRLESADNKEKTYSGTLVSVLQPLFKELLQETLTSFENIQTSDGSNRKLMESIQVNPGTISDSINRDFTNNYNENDVNHFYDIMGFAPQQVVKTSAFDTTKIQYNPSSRTLPETWRNPQTPGVNVVDYIKWFQETLRGVENPDTQYHEALIQENMSFPQKLEMRCTMYRTYFYVKSLLKMIKHKLWVDKNIELDYDDIEDIIPTNLCYFPKSIFNDKKFGDSESNETDIVINFKSGQSSRLYGSQLNGLFNNYKKYSSCSIISTVGNNSVSITQDDDVRNIIIKNKLPVQQTIFCQLNGKIIYGVEMYNKNYRMSYKDINIQKELNFPVLIPIYKNANTNNAQIIKFLVYYSSKRKKEEYKLLVRTFLNNLKQQMPLHPDYEELIDKNDHKKEDVWSTYLPEYNANPFIRKQDSFNIENSFFKITLASNEELSLSFGAKIFFGPTLIEQDFNEVLFDTTFKMVDDYSQYGIYKKYTISKQCMSGYDEFDVYYHSNDADIDANQYVYFKPFSLNIKFNYKTDYEHNWNNLNDLFGNDFKPYKWFFDFCKKYRFYIEYDQFNKKFTIFSKYFTNEHGLKIVNKRIDYNKTVKVEPINTKYSYVQYGYSDKNVPDKTKTDENVQYGDINYFTGYKDGSTLKLVNYDEICPVFTNPVTILFNDILEWIPDTNGSNIPLRNPGLNISILNNISESKFADNEFYAIRGDKKLLKNSNDEDVYYWITSTNDIEIVNNCTCYHATLQFTTYPAGPDISTNEFRNFNYSGTNSNGDNVSIFFNTPSFVLNNESVENSISIYKYRWENYFDEIFNLNNKKITCYVQLSVAEYYNFRFNQLWNIEGNLFIVNKIIDFNPTNNEPTKVELIQVDNIENYN